MSASDTDKPSQRAKASDSPAPARPEAPHPKPDVQGSVLNQVDESLELLEAIAADHSLLAELPDEIRERLVIAAGRVSRPNRARRRALQRTRKHQALIERRERDANRLDQTGIRGLRREQVFPTPGSAESATPLRPKLTSGRGRLPHRPAPIPPALWGPTGNPLATPAAAIAAESDAPVLEAPRNCYVCKKDFHELHSFYDAMCPECADFNWLKRVQTADLHGRVAIVTGGRVKIGYQAAIKLLRAGASVIVSTRFPRDAATRFANEEDFEDWRHRLEVHGLDLRHTPSVEAFALDLNERYPRLDFILNNACQTVRRPPSFYAHMLERETLALAALPEREQTLLAAHDALCRRQGVENREGTGASISHARQWLQGLESAAALSQIPLLPEDHDTSPELFPEGVLDADLQQLDLRGKNSWRLGLDEVSSVELLEVHLVNAVAPFVLNARLKPLMMKVPSRDKHIVNVSAMEGQFYRTFKTDKHPHTNMAKASLNMLTRTSAPDYARDGIHMNSVDTGWITDEDPVEITLRKERDHGFHPPLDIVDAAARICDPIFSGLNTGLHVWGQFLKDYRPTDW